MDAASQLTPACSTSSLSANLHLHGLVGTRAVRVSAAISWGICSGIAEKSFSDTSISLKGLHPAQPGRPRCKRQFRAADVLGVVCSAHLWALVAPGNSRGREGACLPRFGERGSASKAHPLCWHDTFLLTAFLHCAERAGRPRFICRGIGYGEVACQTNV